MEGLGGRRIMSHINESTRKRWDNGRNLFLSLNLHIIKIQIRV